MRRVPGIVKRTLVSLYDDQMTHHAAALTYYALMSLFPAALLALSLLGLLGQYPETYDAIITYLRDVVPETTLGTIDNSLRDALQNKDKAATGVALGVLIALYGTTGVLEASRRALNVVFEVERGRSFLHRKSIDILMTFVLLALVLLTLILVFVGGDFARDVLQFVGFGAEASDAWSIVRWPAAFVAAVILFSLVYWVIPDVHHRGYRWITPGALVGVTAWLTASFLFSWYLSTVPGTAAVYGAFTGAIVLVAWIWLSAICMLLGAELDAEIERDKELSEGVPPAGTLALPAKGAST